MPAVGPPRSSGRLRSRSHTALCAGPSHRFLIDDEIVRRDRPPQRHGVLGLVMLRLPLDRLRDVVDVAGVFGEAAPWILDVVEIVRAEHVATEAPAFGEALVG